MRVAQESRGLGDVYKRQALNRALDGVKGTTAVHICFGYAAIIHERPSGYSFLPEFSGSTVDQISIETAQSNLDTSVLKKLPGKSTVSYTHLTLPTIYSV